MKLKHIYITKEGEPMANPYMEYPDPNKVYPASWNHGYQSQLDKYHSGLLPFEDGHSVDVHLWMKDQFEDYQRPKPDTIIPVDIEVEMVSKEQEEWSDKTGAFMIECKVLRIKP